MKQVPKYKEEKGKMSVTLYRKTIVLSLIAILMLSPCLFKTVNAPGQGDNAIQNPGFESSGDWDAFYSQIQGSYAQVQNYTVQHNGSCSGYTETTSPLQEYCVAYLYQNLEVQVMNVSTFSYWIRKGVSAPDGYYSAEVKIQLPGYTLHYYHPMNPRKYPIPSDTETDKYINAGGPTGSFSQVSRDLYADLVAKFGYSIADYNITGISLCSSGFKDPQSGKKYGQAINWDDVYMNRFHPRTQVNKWAVLIAGGWPGGSLQQEIMNAIDLAYTTLKGLGYDNETIYVLSPLTDHDCDGDNISDVDANNSKANISSSICDWLAEHSDPNDICFIYVMSHGNYVEAPAGVGYFKVAPEGPDKWVYDYNMANWIDQVAYGTLTFVIDCCYAGEFIEELSSSDNRIVITSTMDDHMAAVDIYEPMAVFSYGFLTTLGSQPPHGHIGSVGDGFNAGWQRVQDQGFAYDPWLDDNGDGVGQKGTIPNATNGDDGWFAIGTWL